jgi:hypothetical protein
MYYTVKCKNLLIFLYLKEFVLRLWLEITNLAIKIINERVRNEK